MLNCDTQFDSSVQFRLGHSPIPMAGADYGDTRHIQIAPAPKPK
jgi:hypothetical protein